MPRSLVATLPRRQPSPAQGPGDGGAAPRRVNPGETWEFPPGTPLEDPSGYAGIQGGDPRITPGIPQGVPRRTPRRTPRRIHRTPKPKMKKITPLKPP